MVVTKLGNGVGVNKPASFLDIDVVIGNYRLQRVVGKS